MTTYIWDYNGTIIDDTLISVEVENEMLEKRGLTAGYSIEQYRSMFTFPMEKYYRMIGYTFEDESFDDVAEEFNEIYQKKFSRAPLCEGVIEILEEMHSHHDRCVILSSCEDKALHEQCDILGVSKYFEEIMGIDNLLGGSKIAIAKDWMERTGIHPEDCIYFGDTTADQETAEAIGVKNIILVANGHQSYERLKEINANTVHALSEIKL